MSKSPKHLPSDFERIKGDKARNFQNLKTGEIISRRQYDQRFGVARQFGSYENKSIVNAEIDPLKHYAQPAKGRKSKIKEVEKMTPQQKTDFVLTSKTAALDRELSKKNQKIYNQKTSRKLKNPKQINIKAFKKGKYSQWRDYYTQLSYDAMLDIIMKGKKTGKLFGYMAGFEVLNEKQNKTYPLTLIQLRDFSVEFDYDEFEEMLHDINSRGYLIPIAGIIRLFGEI